jgi:hypothetical protein
MLTANTGESFSFDEDINRREVPALKVHPVVLEQGADDLSKSALFALFALN